MSSPDVAQLGTSTAIDPAAAARTSAAGSFLRWAVFLYAGSILVGVGAGWRALTRPGIVPTVREITPAVALLLTLLALGVLLTGGVRPFVPEAIAWRRTGIALCVSTGFAGALFLTTQVLDITDALWSRPAEAPALGIGLAVLLLSAAVVLSAHRREPYVVVGQVVSFVIFALASVIVVGYLYGDPSLGDVLSGPAVPVQTAVLLMLIAMGVFLMRPGSGLLAPVASPGIGGRLLRRTGILALITPALLLLIAESVPASQQVDVLAFVAVGLGLLVLFLLALGARLVDSTAVQASAAAARASSADAGLEQEAPLVARLSDVLHVIDLAGLDGWDVATRFRPAYGSMAGDASGVIPVDSSIGVVLVDVTGHGVDPALLALRLRDLLLHSLAEGNSPAAALAIAGRAVVTRGELASALVLRVDADSGVATLASAGHPPAIHVTTRRAMLVGPTGPVLFLDPSGDYHNGSIRLDEGESIIVYSDGIADIQRTRLGLTEPEALAEALLAESGDATRMAHLAMGFGDPEPGDDQSVVVLHRTATSAP